MELEYGRKSKMKSREDFLLKRIIFFRGIYTVFKASEKEHTGKPTYKPVPLNGVQLQSSIVFPRGTA